MNRLLTFAAIAALAPTLMVVLNINVGKSQAQTQTQSPPSKAADAPAVASPQAVADAEALLEQLSNIGGKVDGQVSAAERDVEDGNTRVEQQLQRSRQEQAVLQKLADERLKSIDNEDSRTRLNVGETRFFMEDATKSALKAQSHTKEIEATEIQLLQTGSDLAAVQTSLSKLENQLEAEKIAMAALETKVGLFDTRVTKLKDKCEKLETEISRLQKQIPKLEKELATLESEWKARIAMRRAKKTLEDQIRDRLERIPLPPLPSVSNPIPSPSVGGRKLW